MPLNPLRHVQIVVTRRCITDGSVIGADQRLGVDAALRAITTHPARHVGFGDVLGTLESGKEADLTTLESDPYATDLEKISAIKVSETWVGGQKTR